MEGDRDDGLGLAQSKSNSTPAIHLHVLRTYSVYYVVIRLQLVVV